VARLQQTLLRQIGRANKQFGLIEGGDRVMVAISGGKDSWSMLHLLRAYQKVVPFDFSIVAVNLDQGHPGFPVEVLRAYLEREGYEHRIVHRDTYAVVKREIPEGKAYCSLCSRLRRGLILCEERDLAAFAAEQGFPVVPCDLCGSQENLKRVEVRRLLAQLEATNPAVRRNLLAAAGNVKPSHLLDPRLAGAEAEDDDEPAGELIAPRLLVRA
jgi:tRNA 2-thiocytidine biosynthesis protein TtcA